MGDFHLWISSQSTVQLLKTEFHCAESGTKYICVRGRRSACRPSIHAFQWSPAVQALTILLLRHTASGLMQTKEVQLEGESGTPAASLDFALAKQTNWILDMFGVDYEGQAVARKIFYRQNPERRRPGPVCIGVKREVLPAEKIQVFVDDERIWDAKLLFEMADDIEWRCFPKQASSLRQRKTRKSSSSTLAFDKSSISQQRLAAFSERQIDLVAQVPLAEERRQAILRFLSSQETQYRTPSVFRSPVVLEKIRRAFRSEISKQLWRIDIFHTGALRRHLAALTENPTLRKIRGSQGELISELDRDLCTSERLGMSHNEELLARQLCAEPLGVAVPANVVGTVALFTYLKFIKGYSIAINYSFAHTPEVAANMSKDDFAACFPLTAIAVSTGMCYQRSSERKAYHPLMMMPKSDYRIVSPKCAAKDAVTLNKGVYLMQDDLQFSTGLSFAELQRRGLVNKKSVSIYSAEEDERTVILSEANPATRAISYFPFDFFNVEFNNCIYFDQPSNLLSPLGEMTFGEIMLFAHDRLWRNTVRVKALDIALRDAWLQLRSGGRCFDLVVGLMLSDREYLKVLSRGAGLLHLLKGRNEDRMPPEIAGKEEAQERYVF